MRARIGRLFLVNLLLIAAVGALAPNFLQGGNFLSLLNAMALELVVMAAASLLMIGGLLDLSIDGAVAMSGVVAGKVLHDGGGAPWAVAAGLAAGLALGGVNGLAVGRFNLNPLVATLATGWMCFGVAYGITQGQSFYALPAAFQVLGQATLGGLRVIVLYGIAAVAALSFVLHLTPFGAHTYLVGDNAESCRLMGIDVDRVRVRLYLIMGLCSGFVGVTLAARLNAASPIAADGLALRVIAAAVIGGCSLAGGYGSVIGGAFGLFLMNMLANAAILLGITVYWQKFIIGGVLLAAILLDRSGQRFLFLRRKKSETYPGPLGSVLARLARGLRG